MHEGSYSGSLRPGREGGAYVRRPVVAKPVRARYASITTVRQPAQSVQPQELTFESVFDYTANPTAKPEPARRISFRKRLILPAAFAVVAVLGVGGFIFAHSGRNTDGTRTVASTDSAGKTSDAAPVTNSVSDTTPGPAPAANVLGTSTPVANETTPTSTASASRTKPRQQVPSAPAASSTPPPEPAATPPAIAPVTPPTAESTPVASDDEAEDTTDNMTIANPPVKQDPVASAGPTTDDASSQPNQ